MMRSLAPGSEPTLSWRVPNDAGSVEIATLLFVYGGAQDAVGRENR